MKFILRITRGSTPHYYDKCGRWVPWKFRAVRYPTKTAAATAAQPLANALRAPIAVEPSASKRSRSLKQKPRKRKLRRNPAGAGHVAVRQARKLFADFRGEQPRELVRVRLPKKPGALLTVGECIGIMYRTRRDGQVDNYLHRFKKKARPTLAVSSDGRQLYLLGGAYSVTDRGIEDAG